MSEYVKGVLTNFYNCFVEAKDSNLDDVSHDVSHDVSDDWDTVDPEVIQKRLQERKQVEEADHQLTNELFNENHVKVKENIVKTKPPVQPKKKLKIDMNMIDKSYNKNEETRKKITREWKKRKEVFGEAEFDEIDEMSDDIHEKNDTNV